MTFGIVDLPAELIEKIFSFIQPDYHDKEVRIDQRRHLSFESFEPPPLPGGSVTDVGSLRTTCKRFEEIGRPVLFARVVIRFSEDGLRRLRQLSEWQHLAGLVERFTYMVPHFYDDDANNFDVLADELRQFGLGTADIYNLRQKERAQRSICGKKDDSRVLKGAFSRFTKLKIVQLMRKEDQEDRKLLSYLSWHEESRRVLNLNWSKACSHASLTIITALLTSSNAAWSRFSLRSLAPESAQYLSSLAERLEVLTLNFDDHDNLDGKLQELSTMFKELFTKAKGMKAVHLGFPPNHPLTLPLETIFHNVKWEKLVAFGIQAWELEQDEIIGLVRRHPALRGLRLREVKLKDGSMWKDILHFIKTEMHEMEWVALRGIGYTRYTHSEEFILESGTEIPEFAMDSSEDEGEAEEEDLDAAAEEEEDDDDDSNNQAANFEDDDDEADSHDISDDEGHRVDFTESSLNSPNTPASAPWCNCHTDRGPLVLADELGDDGYKIDREKRKYWEQWAIRKCPEHGGR